MAVSFGERISTMSAGTRARNFVEMPLGGTRSLGMKAKSGSNSVWITGKDEAGFRGEASPEFVLPDKSCEDRASVDGKFAVFTAGRGHHDSSPLISSQCFSHCGLSKSSSAVRSVLAIVIMNSEGWRRSSVNCGLALHDWQRDSSAGGEFFRFDFGVAAAEFAEGIGGRISTTFSPSLASPRGRGPGSFLHSSRRRSRIWSSGTLATFWPWT